MCLKTTTFTMYLHPAEGGFGTSRYPRYATSKFQQGMSFQRCNSGYHLRETCLANLAMACLSDL